MQPRFFKGLGFFLAGLLVTGAVTNAAASCTDLTSNLEEQASWQGERLEVSLLNQAEAVAAVGLCFQSFNGAFDQCSVIHDVYITQNNPAIFNSTTTTGRYRFAAQFDFGCEANLIEEFGLALPHQGRERLVVPPD